MTKDSTTSAIETLRKMKGLPTMYNYGDGKRIYGMDEKLFLSVLESFESLEEKLKIAMETLGNANTAFSNILRDKEYESFTLEDFKWHMKASMFLCKSMREKTEQALSKLSL